MYLNTASQHDSLSYTLHLFLTDDCCYYYQSFPGNLTCNPQGRPSAVVLGCSIYSPNGSDVTVRWYRSTQEHLTRVQGELVTNGRNQNYYTRNMQFLFEGLILSHHIRTIENFNENLNGFYWCQIEANNTCLQPSPYGRIIFDSSSERNCSSDNIVIRPVQPLCANNSRTCPVSNTTITSTLSTSMSSTPTALCSDDVVPCNLSIVTSTLSETLCSDGAVPCNLDIVIGAAVMVCILLVVLLVVIIHLIMRRRKEEKMNCVSHSATQSTE